jgi:uncharacterized protein YcnI
MPAGITFALVEAVPGWRTQVVKRASMITELRWSRGRVPPGGYAELHFIARNPVRTGAIAWKALQRYDDGSIVRWIGSPTSDLPAPVTQLSESATPVDVVSTHGESTPAATATSKASVDSGGDGLALGVAIAAAALAAGALGLQLRRRRG